MCQPVRLKVVDLAHPFGSSSKALFQAVCILVAEISDRLRDVDQFMARGQDLRIPPPDQCWRRARHLEHQVGEFFNCCLLYTSEFETFIANGLFVSSPRLEQHGHQRF